MREVMSAAWFLSLSLSLRFFRCCVRLKQLNRAVCLFQQKYATQKGPIAIAHIEANRYV